MNDLKDTIELGLDASGVETGVGRATHSLNSLGRAAHDAGAQGAAGLDKLGSGGKNAADKLERDTRRIVQQIERVNAEMEAGGRNTAQFFEVRARQMGIATDAIQPYIDKLRATEAANQQAARGMQQVGISAGQMSNAMRGLPAQLQDVFVSLQGGQQPMTVLLQQGSQITTQFGSLGEAVRGVGRYLLGFVNPVTATVTALAAVGGVVYAAGRGLNELEDKAFKAGRAISYTTSELHAMAGVLDTGWSQSANALALVEIAENTSLASDELRQFTQLAVDMERHVGKPVADTAKQFRELGDSPTEGVKKLSKEIEFLTSAQYEQIKALEDQGKKTDAARVAMHAYADAVKPSVDRAKAQLGVLGTALEFWRQKANDMWAAVAGATRAAMGHQTGNERADALNRQVQQLSGATWQQGLGVRDSLRSIFNPEGVRRELRDKAQAELDYINEVNRQTARNAKLEQEREERNRAGRDAIDAVAKAYDGALTKGQRMNKELTEFRANLDKIRAANPESGYLDPSRIAAAEKAIRDRYKESGGSKRTAAAPGESEVARIRGLIAEEQAYTRALQERGEQAAKLTAGEKLVMQIQEQLSTSLKGVARSNKEAALAEANKLVQAEKARQVEENRVKALKAAAEANERLVADTWKSADGIERQAAELDAANAMWGKGKIAVEEYRLSQAQEMLAMAEASDSFIPEYVEGLRAIVAARQHLVQASSDQVFKLLNEGIQEWNRQAGERARLYEEETQLAGLTALERNKIVAAREIELKLAREIDRINKSGLGDAEKQALISEATAAAAKDQSAAVARVVQEDWTRTANSINQSLTDALMRGFEGGKGFAKNFRDTLVNMFKTLVLRPVIEAVIRPIGVGLTGMLGGGAAMAQGGGGFGGVGSLLNAGSSMLGGSFGSFLGLGNIGAGFGAGWGALLGGNIGGGLSAGLTALTAGNIGGGLGTLAGVAAPILAPLALLGLSGAFSRKHEQHNLQGVFGGETGFDGQWHDYYRGGLLRSSKTVNTPLQADFLKGLRDAWKASEAAVTSYAQTLGLSTDAIAGFTHAVNIKLKDLDPKASDYQQQVMARVQEAIRAGSNEMAQLLIGTWQSTEEIIRRQVRAYGDELGGWTEVEESVTRQTYVQSEYAREGEQAIDTLTRLATSLQTVRGAFDVLGGAMLQASLAGGDLASRLVDSFGGAENFGAVTNQYWQDYYSDEERAATIRRQIETQLTAVGVAMPDSRAALRSLAEQYQAAMIAGDESAMRAYTAIMQVAGAFAEVTQSAEAAAEAARQLAQEAYDSARSATDAAFGALEKFIAGQRTLWQTALDAANALISEASTIRDTAGDAARDLWGQADDTRAMLAMQGNAAIDQMLGALRTTGALPDADALGKAIAGARGGLDMAGYARSADQEFAQKVLAGKLGEMGELADGQLSIAEQQADYAKQQIKQLDDTLDYWRKQLDLMRNTDLTVTSIADGIGKLVAAMEEERAAQAALDAARNTPAPSTGNPANAGWAIGGSSGSGGGSGGAYLDYTDFTRRYADGSAELLNMNEVWMALWNSSGGDRAAAEAAYAAEEERRRREGIPSYAVGSDYVPRDMLANVHQGEIIVPAVPAAIIRNLVSNSGDSGSAELLAEVRALRDEVAGLRAEQREPAAATVRLSNQFNNVSEGGNALRTEVMA